MNNEEYESPYCDVCGTCGYIGCCGIRNFINEHIQGKTNCKNEDLIISELINLCDYKDEVFKQNNKLKQQLKEKDKEIERLNNVINELEKYLKEENKFDEYKDITYRETMGCVLEELKALKEGK